MWLWVGRHDVSTLPRCGLRRAAGGRGAGRAARAERSAGGLQAAGTSGTGNTHEGLRPRLPASLSFLPFISFRSFPSFPFQAAGAQPERQRAGREGRAGVRRGAVQAGACASAPAAVASPGREDPRAPASPACQRRLRRPNVHGASRLCHHVRRRTLRSAAHACACVRALVVVVVVVRSRRCSRCRCRTWGARSTRARRWRSCWWPRRTSGSCTSSTT